MDQTWDVHSFTLFDRDPAVYWRFLDALGSVAIETPMIMRALTDVQPGMQLRWLDVGAGLGDGSLPVLRQLHRQGVKVLYNYLDPSPNALRIFLSRARQEGLSDLIESTETYRWEDYSPKGRYHLITFGHSAYYIDRWLSTNNNSAEKTLSALLPGGRVLVVHLGEDSDYLTTTQEEIAAPELLSLQSIMSLFNHCGSSHQEFSVQTIIVNGQCPAIHDFIGHENNNFIVKDKVKFELGTTILST